MDEIKSEKMEKKIVQDLELEIPNTARPKRNVKLPSKLNDYAHQSSSEAFEELLKVSPSEPDLAKKKKVVSSNKKALEPPVKKRKKAVSSNNKASGPYIKGRKRKIRSPAKLSEYITQFTKDDELFKAREPVVIPVMKKNLKEKKKSKLDESNGKKIDKKMRLDQNKVKKLGQKRKSNESKEKDIYVRLSKGKVMKMKRNIGNSATKKFKDKNGKKKGKGIKLDANKLMNIEDVNDEDMSMEDMMGEGMKIEDFLMVDMKFEDMMMVDVKFEDVKGMKIQNMKVGGLFIFHLFPYDKIMLICEERIKLLIKAK